ncbi:MAG: MFS transporter [Pseudonocardia sp.]|nr:MFS transporter [Pseudonocardia sp.]
MNSAARPGATLLVVSTAAFLATLDLFIVAIAFPAIRADFPDAGIANLSWVLNAYTVVFAAFLAPAGRLADRFGRRRLFLLGVATFTLASAACALAGSVWLLVVFRMLQAAGAALIMPTSLALLLAAFPAERRSVAVGTWASVGAIAAALGPPVGGLLVEASWRWVFLVNLPICLVTLVVGPRVLREFRDARTGVPDLLGAAGLLLGVGALAYALVKAPEDGWASPGVLVAFGLALLALTWVPWRSTRHPAPIMDLPALRVPTFWLACVAMAVYSSGFAAMLLGNVAFLTGIWGDSALTAGLSLAPGPLVVVIVARLGGSLNHRFGAGPMMVAGGVSFALGVGVWLWRMGVEPAYLTAMLPGQLLTGLGVGLLMPSLSGIVATVLPAARWGSGSSMVNTCRQVGTVLGTAILVLLIGDSPGLANFRHSWLFAGATGVVAAAIGVVIASRRSRDRAPEPAEPAEPELANPAPRPVGAAGD